MSEFTARDIPSPPELISWLSAQSTEDRDEISGLWESLGDAGHIAPEPEENRFHTVDPGVLNVKRTPRISFLRNISPFYYATAACVLLCVGVLLYLQWSSPKMVETLSDRNLRTVELADGSVVTLNADSRLTYASDFGTHDRKIVLEGEASFDVEKSTIPFVVETFNAQVTVTGTVFNVRARSSDRVPSTIVNLEEGSVILSSGSGETFSHTLAPGETASVVGSGSGPTTPRAATYPEISPWKSGKLVFENAPIGDIIDELERRFGVRILVDESVAPHPFSLYLTGRTSVESVLNDLGSSAGFRYREVPGGFEVLGFRE